MYMKIYKNMYIDVDIFNSPQDRFSYTRITIYLAEIL